MSINRTNIEYYDIAGLVAETPVSISTTAAQSTTAINVPSPGGLIYQIHTDVACFIKIATTADDVTVDTGFPMNANTALPFIIRDGEKVGAITASGSGTVRIHRAGLKFSQ